MPTTNLGKVTIVSKGAYSASVTYEKLDVATYNGSSYIALKTTKGNAPTNTSYWSLLAQKGDKGDQGIQGIKGDTGEGVPEGGDSGHIVVRNLNGNTWENPAFVKPDLTEEYYKNVTDSADFPFTDFQVNGNTYQAQGTGKNIFDFNTLFKEKLDSGAIKEIHPNSYMGIMTNFFYKRYFTESDIGKAFTFSADATLLTSSGDSSLASKLMVHMYDDSKDTPIIKTSYVDEKLDGINVKKHLVIENIVPENTTTCVMITYATGTPKLLFENIQLEQSETETEFEPYTNLLPAPTPDNPMPIINAGTLNTSGKYEVHMSLSDGTNTQNVTLTSDVELTKWDRLERRDGVWGWSINSAKRVFDGTEDWKKYTNFKQTSTFLNTIVDGGAAKVDSKCSHFKKTVNFIQVKEFEYYDENLNDDKYFALSSDITTIEQCKQFFADKYSSGDPVIFWYKTEIEVSFNPLSEEEQTLLNNLRTYYPQTTFIVEDYATVTGKYVADAKTYIDNKVSELEALVASAYTMGVNSIE